jgi:hypothetical protein
MTNVVDAVGTARYMYTACNRLRTEDGPFASDILTNTYTHRLRTRLDLQQPTGIWTNGFGYDLPREIAGDQSRSSAVWRSAFKSGGVAGPRYLTGRAQRLTSLVSPVGSFTYILGGAGAATLITSITPMEVATSLG